MIKYSSLESRRPTGLHSWYVSTPISYVNVFEYQLNSPSGSAAEKSATIRHGASIMAALYHATIPIFTVIIRRSFGVAGGALSDLGDGLNNRVAW